MSECRNNVTAVPVANRPLRVLVADDDPASLRYLSDALSSLGVDVRACADGLTASSQARNECFDVLLLDCHMPGQGALEILQRLRRDAEARSIASVAVATTAEISTQERQSLLAAGFSDILLKPCTVHELRGLLGVIDDEQQPLLLDDASALSSSGDAATMQALRQLLRGELSQLQSELDALSENQDDFVERLHRLRSSCGFCGATTLAAHAASMQWQVTRHSMTAGALTAFRVALQKTLRALESQQGPPISGPRDRP